MARNSRGPGGLSPALLAALTVIGLTVAGVVALGGMTKSKQGKQPGAASNGTRTRSEEPVDPFASLPREEWDSQRRQSRLVSSQDPDGLGDERKERAEHEAPRDLPEITGEGWTGALEAGRLADESLERARALRGEVDIDIYKAEARRAKQLYEQALELGAPILEALGDEAAGTGVERRMSTWTNKLIALKKTTGL